MLVVMLAVTTPLTLGPMRGVLARALGAFDHACACGMAPGTCGCPACARLERETQNRIGARAPARFSNRSAKKEAWRRRRRLFRPASFRPRSRWTCPLLRSGWQAPAASSIPRRRRGQPADPPSSGLSDSPHDMAVLPRGLGELAQ